MSKEGGALLFLLALSASVGKLSEFAAQVESEGNWSSPPRPNP